MKLIETMSPFNPPQCGDEIKLSDGSWIIAHNNGNWCLHRPGMNQIKNLKIGSIFDLNDFIRALIENE